MLTPFVSDAGAASRRKLTIPVMEGVVVESFGDCAKAICPAVVILGGSKGFESAAYDEIGETFKAAGLNAYLVHAVSKCDLSAISAGNGARTRIVYYAKRMPTWISSVQGVVDHLKSQSRHGGKVGVLGISLGAQIASAASVGRNDIGALVLIDGGFPNGYSHPVRSLPPLHLIWCSADRVFPLSVAQEMKQKVQQIGGLVTLDVYEGGAHDFFLRSGTRNADEAHHKAAEFLAADLSR